MIVQYLCRQGVLTTLSEHVRFARRRFGHYDVIDFIAVLLGYAISGERTLEVFYERLQPCAIAFMALFGRDHLPARSTLSRFLSALTPEPVEALRTLFLADLLARQWHTAGQAGGLWDRQGTQWVVFDVDGTREAARQRALPQTDDRPAAQRRLRPLCAPGYTGRKRGEVVRTRTTVLQAHTHQWLGTFGNPGNGAYRTELRRAVTAIQSYVQGRYCSEARAILRLDGLYGSGVVLADLADLAYVLRGKDYHLLDRAEVQLRLSLPDAGQFSRPESPLCRTLYDCPNVPIGLSGTCCRIVVATHPAGPTKNPVGVERDGVVYELFLTNLPQRAFTAADVVILYLQRGAFETTLADEDQEQDPDRWCSHTPWGQECWQILSQWVWNMRLELGHHLLPEPVRTTELAPALPSSPTEADAPSLPPQEYGPAEVALPWKQDRFSGRDFALQPDGTLRCPAGQHLVPHERRREADGSLRVVYGASIRSCRPCPLREQCQWQGRATAKPRQVSLLLHPLPIAPAPVLWRDWSRRRQRRACHRLLYRQQVEIQVEPALPCTAKPEPVHLSRAQRAHYRLSWAERLARNARIPPAAPVQLTLFGVPDDLAVSLGLATV
jgi:hypothetical protein